MPTPRPIDIAQELRLGGVDRLIKTIDDRPALKNKEVVKRLALVEVILWGLTGERAGPAEVSEFAVQSLAVSMPELVIEAKVQAQKIPPQTLVS